EQPIAVASDCRRDGSPTTRSRRGRGLLGTRGFYRSPFREVPGLGLSHPEPSTQDHRSMPAQYIFTIESLSKAYGKKDVLKNIWLAFYPGAKIGVIGGNGSGKSPLLRIMAGHD